MIDYEYEEYDKQFNQRKEYENSSKEKFARDQIKHTIKTSIITCAIGALSDIEKLFGEQWGIGKDYNELTSEQRNMKKLWGDTRDSILERASNGIRLSFRDIDRCNIKDYNRKKYNVVIKPKRENRDGR